MWYGFPLSHKMFFPKKLPCENCSSIITRVDVFFCVFIYIKIKWHNGPFCRIFFTAAVVAAFVPLWYYCFGVLFLCWMGLSVIYVFCEVLVCLLSYSSRAFVYFIIVSMFKCIFSIPKQVRTHAHAHNTIFGGHCQQF